MTIQITKFSGEKEPYSEDKIRASATRVGVPRDLQDEMLTKIREHLFDGISTKAIYQIIQEYLSHSRSPFYAAKFNLKAALAALGPSGYPFEQYLAKLLEALGYSVQTNQTLRGECVSHEIDLIAKKNDKTYFIEAKFHTQPNQRTDIKVALYIQARYEDLSSRPEHQAALPWIMTNTRFSSDAITYAECRHLRVTSWGYPQNEGIMDLIEQTALHPITILTTLTPEDLRLLLSQNIIVCKQLTAEVASLLPLSRREAILTQARAICGAH